MKKDPSLELQKAIFDTLTPALVPVKVYDRVPPGAIFPYVTIGDDLLLDDIAECIDGSECFANVHVWSQKVGKTEAKQISKKVIQALYTEFSLTDFRICDASVDGLSHLSDPDGVTSHSIVTMRYLIEPTT